MIRSRSMPLRGNKINVNRSNATDTRGRSGGPRFRTGHTSGGVLDTEFKGGYIEIEVIGPDYDGTDVRIVFKVGDGLPPGITHYGGIWLAGDPEPSTADIKAGTGAIEHVGPAGGNSEVAFTYTFNPLPDRQEYILYWVVTDSKPTDFVGESEVFTYQNTQHTGAPVITGDEYVGGTLQIAQGTLDDPDGLDPNAPNAPGWTYNWLGAGSPTDQASYVCVAGDEGNTVTCQLNGQDNYQFPVSTSATSGQIGPAPVWGFTNIAVLTANYTGTQVQGQFDVPPGAGPNINHYYGLWLNSATPSDLDVITGTGAVLHNTSAGTTGVLHQHTFAALPDTQTYALHWVASDDQAADHRATKVVTQYANTPHSGDVLIDGTPAALEVLTARTTGITDPDGISTPWTYQWSNAAGSPTNQGTYTVTDDDVGNEITLTVSTVDDYNFSIVEQATTPPIADVPNRPAEGAPDIAASGDAAGDTLTASKGTITDPDGTTNYEALAQYAWTGVAGSPTNQAVYTLVAADFGNTVTVTANFTDDRGTAESRSNTYAVPANNAATGAPAITGTPTEGEVLTASAGTIADADGTTGAVYAYSWSGAGTPTDQATYTIVNADVGTQITVDATFTDDRGTPEGPLTSAPTAVVDPLPNNPATGEPNITGLAQDGETLTADIGTVDDADGMTGAVYAWSWNGAGTPTDQITYDVVTGDIGNTLTVTVSFTDDRGFAESRDSAPTDIVAPIPNNPATGKPAISGTAQVGQVLTASQGTIADPDGISGPITYTWDGAGSPTVGTTYRCDADDVGNPITVSATFTDDRGYSEGPLASDPTALVVIPDNIPATGKPHITASGELWSGTTLTADPGTIADQNGLTGASYTYVWNGATGTQANPYTIVDTDVGRSISVRAEFTDDWGYSEARTSDVVGPIIEAPKPEFYHDFTQGYLPAGAVHTRGSYATGYYDTDNRFEKTGDAPVFVGLPEGGGGLSYGGTEITHGGETLTYGE